MSKTTDTLPPSDVVTLMAALAIAAERFPDASEYEAMRQRLLKSSEVTIETPRREEHQAALNLPGNMHPGPRGGCPVCPPQVAS